MMKLRSTGTSEIPAIDLTTPLAVVDGGTGTSTVKPYRMQLGTVKSYNWNELTTNTVLDFEGIPAWVKKITVMLNGVSTNGTSAIALRIGPTITPETTGYSSTGGVIGTVSAGAATSSTHWLIGGSAVAARARSGQVVLTLMNASLNIWTYSGDAAEDTFSNMYLGTGSKAIASPLGVVRLTTVNGTDVFDAGSVNIMYEGYED